MPLHDGKTESLSQLGLDLYTKLWQTPRRQTARRTDGRTDRIAIRA